MSAKTVANFPVGAELSLNLGSHGPRWYAFMRKDKTSGGWVRQIYADGSLDNSREGIRLVRSSLVVLDSRAVPVKGKAKKNSSGDPFHQ